MNSVPLISQDLTQAVFPSSQSAVLVYFSAHWCGPCRQFTPLLKTFYNFGKECGADLEIIFVSSDRTEQDMVNYYQQSHGPWLAVPFYSTQRNFLSTHFGVKGIPALFLLNKGTLHAVDEEVRLQIQQVAMMRNSSRVKEIVDTWRVRSGAMLFQQFPASMSMLMKEDRELVFELLTRIIGNIADHPTESKFRQLRSDNAVLNSTILQKVCGSLPLSAIGFFNSGNDTFEYRACGVDPKTVHVILLNRHANGLGESGPQGPVGKLRILYRNNPAIETEESVIESMELLSALVESLTDVGSEEQKLFAPLVTKMGPLMEEALMAAFGIAFSANRFVDVLVLGQQTLTNPTGSFTDDEANKSASELRSKVAELGTVHVGMSTVLNAVIHAQIYEVPSNQAKALEVVPVWDLHQEAIKQVDHHYSENLLVATLAWYKRDFFAWVDKPRCSQCRSVSTSLVNGKAPPTLQEAKGLASVVELFACEVCGSITRFPRFNHPAALLHTRSGRCGEWSNCFALIARAMGFEVRRVHDSADHVWLEVWMEHRREWVHCDPCENAYDQPLLYEQGWGKASSFTFACSKDGVRDVSRRYTQHPLASLASPVGRGLALKTLNAILQKHWAVSEARLAALVERDEEEDVALNLIAANSEPLPSRTSGAPEWIAARGETGFFIGNDNDEIDVSKCLGPVKADTIPFSDEHLVRSAAADLQIPKMNRISLWAANSLLTGIHCEYDASTEITAHLATEAIGRNPTASSTDTRITKVELRHTPEGISWLSLWNDEEVVLAVGDAAVGTYEEIPVIPGTYVVGFLGGMGATVHNLGILTAPIPMEEIDQTYSS